MNSKLICAKTPAILARVECHNVPNLTLELKTLYPTQPAYSRTTSTDIGNIFSSNMLDVVRASLTHKLNGLQYTKPSLKKKKGHHFRIV